jgi:hypothetical protein
MDSRLIFLRPVCIEPIADSKASAGRQPLEYEGEEFLEKIGELSTGPYQN